MNIQVHNDTHYTTTYSGRPTQATTNYQDTIKQLLHEYTMIRPVIYKSSSNTKEYKYQVLVQLNFYINYHLYRLTSIAHLIIALKYLLKISQVAITVPHI
jgi:hypothetical protein